MDKILSVLPVVVQPHFAANANVIDFINQISNNVFSKLDAKLSITCVYVGGMIAEA